jgi:hypothetical protein
VAATLAEQYIASQDESFRAVVRIALGRTVLAVIAEDPETPNHADRMTLASKVMERLDWYVGQTSVVLAGQGLDASSPDEYILGGVAQLVTAAALLRLAGNQA